MARRPRQPVAVVDASALYALVDADDHGHESCVETLRALMGAILALSPFALTEADYLVSRRLGVDAELAMLRDVERNSYRLYPFTGEDVGQCLSLVDRYRDLGIGLADASLAVLADRLGTRRVFTLDRRHFEVMRPLSGGRFELVPEL